MDNYNTNKKTISVYSDDDTFIKQKGIAYKNVIRLGTQALQSGWSINKETTQIDELKQRIAFMSRTLQMYIDKTDVLVKYIKKTNNIGINIDELTDEELRRKLEDME